MPNIKKQLSLLYSSSIVGSLSITGAWVAILAARGFTLVEIGLTETVFHIVSLLFEIPSGVLADIFGRKKMLIASRIMSVIASVIMILSNDLLSVCISIAFIALSYNCASGSDTALAYDSLKLVGQESHFEKYNSNMFLIYRICTGISTLCAGLALFIGHKLAYGTDLVMLTIQMFILSRLEEVYVGDRKRADIRTLREFFFAVGNMFKESFCYIKEIRKALGLMLCNSFVGAFDVLLLFFLQAKLPERGISGWTLGLALLFMQMGGVVGARLILKAKHLPYRWIFAATLSLVMAGVLLEHSGSCLVMALGGFLAALGDDAMQIKNESVLQDMFPSEQRATLTSVESFSFSVIMIVMSPLAVYFFTYRQKLKLPGLNCPSLCGQYKKAP